jgi:transcriptional regulator GlxA family with amidase domain
MSPMEYVRRHRLSMARRLLDESTEGCSVSQVARRTGFSQLARFSAAYQATYGETPTETIRRVKDQVAEEAES